MMYVSISRDWLFSPTARRVYLICAILNLALLATRMGIVLAMVAAGVSTLPSGARLLVRALLAPKLWGVRCCLSACPIAGSDSVARIRRRCCGLFCSIFFY